MDRKLKQAIEATNESNITDRKDQWMTLLLENQMIIMEALTMGSLAISDNPNKETYGRKRT